MPGARAQRDDAVVVKREDVARKEDGALPVYVDSFLLVGRKAVKTVGGREVPGVIRMWRPTFGKGQQHDGLRVRYHPNPLEQEGPEDTPAMDTDFTFYVAWEGSDELEELSLEEAQAVATQEWCDDFLPEALRRLVKGGRDGSFDWELWATLDGSKAAQTYLKDCENFERKERAKRQAASTRKAKAAGGKAAAPRATAKRTGGAPGKKAGAAAKAKKPTEPAPLRAPQGVADAFQLKAAAKRARQEEARRAAAAAAASGEPVAPSPAKKARVLGELAPLPCISPPVAQAAAAAARVVPSGQGSPSSRAGAAAPSRRKQTHPTAVASDSVADSSSRQRQQQEAAQQQQQRAGTGVRQRQQAVRAPSTAGRSKQQTLSPTKSGKSRGSGGRSTGGKQQPAVFRQQEQAPVVPADSARLRQEDARSMKVVRDTEDEVFWYDSVVSEDGTLYRAYCRKLILPEKDCLRSRDRKLRTWKGKDLGSDVEYGVECLLAEREGDDGETRYLVKWAGFEADPTDDSWLEEGDLSDSKEKLQQWRSRGRAEWMATSQAVLREASIEHA